MQVTASLTLSGENWTDLAESEYKQSGVDKLQTLKMGLLLSELHLGFGLKPLLKKGPPFYYFDESSHETRNLNSSSVNCRRLLNCFMVGQSNPAKFIGEGMPVQDIHDSGQI